MTAIEGHWPQMICSPRFPPASHFPFTHERDWHCSLVAQAVPLASAGLQMLLVLSQYDIESHCTFPAQDEPAGAVALQVIDEKSQ